MTQDPRPKIGLQGKKKNFKNFMAPFYGWDSTASRLEPLWGGSLLFTTTFPEVPGTHFIDLRDERLSRPCSHPVVLNTGPLDWESCALTTRPLLHGLAIAQMGCFYAFRYTNYKVYSIPSSWQEVNENILM